MNGTRRRRAKPAVSEDACDGAAGVGGRRRATLHQARLRAKLQGLPGLPGDGGGARREVSLMGSPQDEPDHSSQESPQHKVTIAKPFAVGKFAVRFAEWDACASDGGCSGETPSDEGWGRGDRPVINVNWNEAKNYIDWLSKKTGKEYRLLTEAEREYVTRAGTTTPFWWGRSITPVLANYDGSVEPYNGGGSRGEYRHKTMPVKFFKPNPWGLYQVHGNVWEWTEDCWHGSYDGAPAGGSAWTTGECVYHVLRGGSWDFGPRFLRAAHRDGSSTLNGHFNFGFRVARTLD